MNRYHLKITDQKLIDLIGKSNDPILEGYLAKGVVVYGINEDRARESAHKNHSIMITRDIKPGSNEIDETILKINSEYYNAWKNSLITTCHLIE